MRSSQLLPPTLALSLIIPLAQCGESPAEPRHSADNLIRSENGVFGGSQGGITVPLSGSTAHGDFKGTLTITGADFDAQLGPVVVGEISGTYLLCDFSVGPSPGHGGPTTCLSLLFADVEFNYQEDVKSDDDCIEIEISPPDLTDNETKTTVQFDVSVLSTHAIPGPANLIADLICATDRAIEAGWSVQEGGEV